MNFSVTAAEAVGDEPPSCAVSWVSGYIVRVDCHNNPAFWMEIDVTPLSTKPRGSVWTARGRIANSDASQHGFQVAGQVGKAGFGYAVTHPDCPDFLLEIFAPHS